MKNKILYIPFLLLGIFSCEKEIEFKGEGKDPVLVLNGIVENDSIFKVYLERSFFFLSNEPQDNKFIKTDVTMKLTNLTSGEVFTKNQSTIDNVYEFPFVTNPNTRYKIEVSHPDYESIYAEMTTAPKIDLIDVDTNSYQVDNNFLNRKATLKWKDPLGENYYLVRLSYQQSGNLVQLSFKCSDPSIEINPGLVTNSGLDLEKNYYSEIYFTDESFQGKIKELEINFDQYISSSIGTSITYTYQLISINKETFLYYQSIQKTINSNSFFSEPVKVYSNINNGFGIFGSMSSSKITK